MEHEIAVLKARIRLLTSDNILLQQRIREKNREITLLKRQIKCLELKVPHLLQETQLSIYDLLQM